MLLQQCRGACTRRNPSGSGPSRFPARAELRRLPRNRGTRPATGAWSRRRSSPGSGPLRPPARAAARQLPHGRSGRQCRGACTRRRSTPGSGPSRPPARAAARRLPRVRSPRQCRGVCPRRRSSPGSGSPPPLAAVRRRSRRLSPRPREGSGPRLRLACPAAPFASPPRAKPPPISRLSLQMRSTANLALGCGRPLPLPPPLLAAGSWPHLGSPSSQPLPAAYHPPSA